jgi:hypothetical protein
LFSILSARAIALCAALSLALAAFLPHPSSAQSATFISGVVTANGGPAAGADVELKGNNLDIHRTADDQGRFSFVGLTVGQYEIIAKKGDLSTTQVVELTGGGTTLQLAMQPPQEIGHAVVSARPAVAQGAGTDVVIDSQTLSKLPGTNSIPNILLQLPTAAQGSNGEIHLNGDHNGINYIVDGVPLPEGLNRVVGNEIDPSTIGFMNVIQGAFPAQYGGPFASILDIGTKNETGPPGATFQGRIGSYNLYDGILDAHAPVGQGGSLLVSGRFFRDGRALDPPSPTSGHNDGSTTSQFLRLSLPLGQKDFVNVDFINSLQTFQIPPDVNSGTPADTDDNEKQYDTFASVQFRHTISDNASFSFGPSFKHSRIVDYNDLANDLAAGLLPNNQCGPVGDFSDCPVFSVFADREFNEFSINADYAYHSSRHDVRIGAITGTQNVPKNYVITLQAGNKLMPQNPDGTFTAVDNSTINGTSQGFYAQDAWQWSPHWQLQYGVRFDAFSVASTTSIAPFSNQYDQTSPRTKLTYFFSPRTSVYAYYGRLFSPFSLESIDPAVAATLYVPGPTNPGAVFDLKPERDSLYETGFHLPLGKADLGFRLSHKVATDYIDDTQVGDTNLHQDINFPQGRVDSQSILAQVPLPNRSTFAASVAHVVAVTSLNCETQLLQNCAGAAPPGGPFFQADHDQHYTANASVILNDNHGGWFSATGQYGSGLSQDPSNCPPLFDTINCKVPPHTIFSVAKAFGFPYGQLIFSIDNLFNDRYAITLNNALQGTHYARPRSFEFRFIVGTRPAR